MQPVDLVAAAALAPLAPPAGWFDDPHLAGPTAMTITAAQVAELAPRWERISFHEAVHTA